MHPSGRFGVLVRENEGHIGCWIGADACAGSASKAIANRVVKEVECVEMLAGCSMKPKGVPHLVASAERGREEGHHSVPSQGV